MPPVIDDKWMTPKEAGDVLRCDAKTIIRLVLQGKLVAVNRSAGRRPRYLVDVDSVNNFHLTNRVKPLGGDLPNLPGNIRKLV